MLVSMNSTYSANIIYVVYSAFIHHFFSVLSVTDVICGVKSKDS